MLVLSKRFKKLLLLLFEMTFFFLFFEFFLKKNKVLGFYLIQVNIYLEDVLV